MLRIFNRLRQGTPPDKRTRSYFLYALGEIVLVMIGILLALQVNNWNEGRKDRKNEIEALRDLQIEFLENLADAQRVLEGNRSIYEASGRLQENISSRAYGQPQTDSLLYFLFDWYDYTPKPGASDNLINAGHLGLISNKDLRKSLTLWTGVIDELDDDEQLAIRYSQQVIVPYLATHMPLANLEHFDNLLPFYTITGYEDLLEMASPDPQPYDTAALLSDPVFHSHVSAKKMYARHNMMECQKLIIACREILDLISKELELRKAGEPSTSPKPSPHEQVNSPENRPIVNTDLKPWHASYNPANEAETLPQ